MGEIVALDLFAGTGWGVACKRLGIEERAVEIMPEAIATRAANGMETTYHDVWDGILLSNEMHELLYGAYELLIGSPPCQTFSVAGNGAGRKALNEVIEAIQLHAYKDPQRLLEFGEKHDMRTALVLTPLAYVYRDRPTYVALEQVPTVLPVWQACAEVMREMGYSVKVAVLQAEQYGVPQTRKRAILVARLDGEEVQLPTPTHSAYYPASPTKLDPGVLPWVSMAEALGWTEDPQSKVFCPTNLRPNAGFRSGDRPSTTLAFGHDNPRWITPEELEEYRRTGAPKAGVKLTQEELAALQSYPSATARATADPRPGWTYTRPSTTIVGTFSPDIVSAPAGREKGGHSRQSQPGSVRVSHEQAAALQSYPTTLRSNYGTGGDPAKRGERTVQQPAATLTGKADRNKWDDGQAMTAEQATTLQAYPTEPPFVWCGTKSKVFLQIGNAVPPLLAEHVLRALVAEPSLI